MDRISENFYKIYSFIFFLFLVGISWTYFHVESYIGDIDKKIIKIEIKKTKELSQNIKEQLLKIINSTKDDIQKKKKLNQFLNFFISEGYENIYLFYKDKTGKITILASTNNSKNIFKNQTDQYLNILKKKGFFIRPNYILYNSESGIKIIYFYPLNNKKMVLVYEIASSIHNSLMSIFKPIKNLYYIFLILLILALFFILFQSFLYFKQKFVSYIDPLTHLYNRKFLNKIEKKINLNHSVLIMADIDFFKSINDKYGHSVGDIVLEAVSKRLLNSTRTFDKIIRYGGEEFLIILNNKETQNIQNIMEVCERILHSVSDKPVRIGKNNIKTTISLGVNLTPYRDKTLNNAIKKADKMLYIAKNSGRNKIVTTNKKEEEDNIIMLSKIISAINKRKLQIFFQPILDLKTNKISQYEALARLIDNNGKIYFPSQFLSIIKYTPTYLEFLENILLQSFDTIQKHEIKVNINIFMNDILQEDIYAVLKNIITTNSSLAKYLVLELEDEYNINDLEKLSKKINFLKSLGAKIATNSFTNGQDNLNYFINIKPDYIKIDSSYILSKLIPKEETPVILENIINICNSLNIKTIAGFVENREILNIVKNSGIDLAQGFYIGKPIDISKRKWIPKILFFDEQINK